MAKVNKMIGNTKTILQVSLSASYYVEAEALGSKRPLNPARQLPKLKEKGIMVDNTEYHLVGMYSSFILLIAVTTAPLANP